MLMPRLLRLDALLGEVSMQAISSLFSTRDVGYEESLNAGISESDVLLSYIIDGVRWCLFTAES